MIRAIKHSFFPYAFYYGRRFFAFITSIKREETKMKTTSHIVQMKKDHEPISMLTAYDYPSAKYVEQAGADLILVGDSVGMVVLGYESTVQVTVEDMIHHTKAVKRGAKDTFIVTDMPFMSYHISEEKTLEHAQDIVQKGGAHAVKLEGGAHVIPMIKKLTLAGVPVVGHLGLTPQSVGVLGGYRVQGKDTESAENIIKEAKMIEEAGAFALVLECIPMQLAKIVTESINIPTIGIGAGVDTDGQVLVYHDIINYGVDRTPKFVKSYGNVSKTIEDALSSFVSETKNRDFPTKEYSFTMKEEQLSALYGGEKDVDH
jgi:3-methyl-2-oxobutanoate hydroxymethyltransferase